MKSHELFVFIPQDLAAQILEDVFTEDKMVYKTTLEAVAQLRKVRSIYLERQPRKERHAFMVSILGRPAMEVAVDNLIRTWLLKKHTPLITDFLDALKIPHQKGVVEDIPPTIEDAALEKTIDTLLGKYPPKVVTLYLHAFHEMNEKKWANLEKILNSDSRLAL